MIRRNKKVFVFISAMMLFLVGAGIIQEVLKYLEPFEEVSVAGVETNEKEIKVSEKLLKPVKGDVKVAKEYYDTDLPDDQLENALVYFEGVYRPNDGIDYVGSGSFDVYACASGKVVRKENDALLGWILVIEHKDGLTSTYQAIDDIKVEKGETVKQGEVIGKAGKNVYQSSLKEHLHFIISINNKSVNPNKYFNQKIENIKIKS